MIDRSFIFHPQLTHHISTLFTDGADSLESRIVETLTYSAPENSQWMHNTHGQNMRIAELVAQGLPPEVSARDAYETMRLCFSIKGLARMARG